jgi:hypothetical protein
MLVVWIGALALAPSQSRRGDVLRFYEIAHGGTPYTEQQVEYPPLETAMVFVVGASSQTVTVAIVALVNAGATIGCWRLLRARWAPGVGRLFLWFALPLQVFMTFRIDTVSVLFPVRRCWHRARANGVAAARREPPRCRGPVQALADRARADPVGAPVA